MLSGLDCIGGLVSGDLSKNSMLVSGRKLGRTTSRRHLAMGEGFVKGSVDCTFGQTSPLGNRTRGVAMRGQGKDVFLISRGDGAHVELQVCHKIGCGYIALDALPKGCVQHYDHLSAWQRAVCTANSLYQHH